MTGPNGLGHVAPRNWDWIIRKLTSLQKQINTLTTARSLEAAQIGRGGISIKGGALKLLDMATGAVLVVLDSLGLHVFEGGKIDVNDGGKIDVNDSGQLNLNDGSDQSVNDGGGITINDGGTLLMKTPAGNVIVQFQRIPIPDGSGRLQQVFALGRDDGTLAFALADLGSAPGHAHQQNWAFYDRAGNIVFADDTDSGQGLAWPIMSMGPFMSNGYPTDTTTSAAFVTLQTLVWVKQHPKVYVQVLGRADDPATTGEIRVVDQDGNVIGPVQTVDAGAYSYYSIGPAALPGAHGLSVSLNIQARVTAGTGSIGVRGISALAVAS